MSARGGVAHPEGRRSCAGRPDLGREPDHGARRGGWCLNSEPQRQQVVIGGDEHHAVLGDGQVADGRAHVDVSSRIVVPMPPVQNAIVAARGDEFPVRGSGAGVLMRAGHVIGASVTRHSVKGVMSQTPVRNGVAQPSHWSRHNGTTRSVPEDNVRTGAQPDLDRLTKS